jgi:hypothetical protein
MYMKNDNEEKKDEKPIRKTSLKTYDALYEMVYDRENNTTDFIKATPSGEIVRLNEVEHGGKVYIPLSPYYGLIDKGVMLFPSDAVDYVDEETLLEDIRLFIHKYLEVTPVFERIATYYVLFTWLYDKFNEVPYLRAIGDFGSGKSRFIQTIGSLCYKPVFTGGATTPSPIFRIIDEVKGTLILDEADFRFSDMTSDIVKILNTGYQHGMPVLRSEGRGTFEVKAYDVYGPKIIATRETFKDKALESRFLVEEMGSRGLRSDIPRTLDESFYSDATDIRNKLLKWRFDNYFKPIERREELIEGIHPRLNQIVIPLLSIINSKSVREELKTFIIEYNKELVADRGLSWESDIVFAILKLQFEGDISEVTVKQIADEVNINADMGDDFITPKKIGWYLRSKLQLKPYKTRRGFVLRFLENNKKLDMWKGRFGITDADIRGEDVNNENIVNITDEPDILLNNSENEHEK